METKNKNFYAPSCMERATKFFICLILLLLFSCNTTLASNQKLTVNNIKQILNYFNPEGYDTTLYTEERLVDFVNTANNATNGYIGYEKGNKLTLNYDGTLNVKGAGRYITFEGTTRSYINFNEDDNTYEEERGRLGDVYLNNFDYLYCIGGWTNSSGNGIDYVDGWSNIDIITFYQNPFFEYSANKIGTTTLENFDGNIPCFYPKSFTTYSNSYATFKEIGKIYIDSNYLIENIYTSVPTIYLYNLNQTQSWEYKNYLIFKTESLKDGYIAYSVNIDIRYINTPYIYKMEFETQDTSLGNNITINFVLLTENTEGGGIIVESGDQNISGDFDKDNTKLGDIQNTINGLIGNITEPYDPNKNILNEMTSGEILTNMGYQTTEDPNKDLWDTIINGLKETLTANGNVTLELPLRSQIITVNSDEIRQPENELKTFTGLFVNFWLLMKMFSFIKKTIDQINEGNLKVMHEVDADCYFF